MTDPFREIELVPLPVIDDGPQPDPMENPFKLVVDPVMRVRLRRALFDLIENHDHELATHVSEGVLLLDTYKEYIELFARSLRETMGTKEGVSYLLQACGFDLPADNINLTPAARWQVHRQDP